MPLETGQRRQGKFGEAKMNKKALRYWQRAGVMEEGAG